MRFLVAIHHANDFDASASEDQATRQAIDDLNDEMEAAGARLFACGLHHPSTARSLVGRQDGSVLVTEGPYLKTGEHVGGFWILKCESHEEAMEWGRKATLACKTPVEVRQFH